LILKNPAPIPVPQQPQQIPQQQQPQQTQQSQQTQQTQQKQQKPQSQQKQQSQQQTQQKQQKQQSQQKQQPAKEKSKEKEPFPDEIRQKLESNVSVEFVNSQVCLSASYYFTTRKYHGIASYLRVKSENERVHGLKIADFIVKRGYPISFQYLV